MGAFIFLLLYICYSRLTFLKWFWRLFGNKKSRQPYRFIVFTGYKWTRLLNKIYHTEVYLNIYQVCKLWNYILYPKQNHIVNSELIKFTNLASLHLLYKLLLMTRGTENCYIKVSTMQSAWLEDAITSHYQWLASSLIIVVLVLLSPC